jgi:hypothetical protein
MRWDRSGATLVLEDQVREARRVGSARPEGATSMSPFLWILLGVLYLTALFVLGLATLRKGHTALPRLGAGRDG